MVRTEIALQKRPTAVTLLDASREGRSSSFFDGRTAEQERVLERVRKIPFSPMWRQVIDGSDPTVLEDDFARRIFKAAKNCNEKNFLKTVSRQLAGSFPAELLQAEIDPELGPKKPAQYEGPKSLAVFLREARGEYAQTLKRRSGNRGEADTQSAISDSWIKLAAKLAGRDKERHARIFEEAGKAYNLQFVEAEAVVELGYENLNPAQEALFALAPVLARNFPRTVISHLRAPQQARVETKV